MTPRRQRAYELLMQGLCNKEIAVIMNTTPKSVKELLSYVFKETNTKSRAELIVKHYQEQLRGLPKGIGI